MNRPNNFTKSFLCGCVLLVCVCATAANLPSGWQREQSFDVSAAGLLKIELPVETLDGARAALEDLRLYDDSNHETPYLIERPVPTTKMIRDSKSFHLSLNPDTTVITVETGSEGPLDAVTLETPSKDFIKAVRAEGSDDGNRWQLLAEAPPIFRQSYGTSHLQVSFPSGVFKWLRLTLDDQRSQPIPLTGALVHLAAAKIRPGELISAVITERDENPRETRIAVNLGAADLSISSVHFETAEPLFMREVSIAFPAISEDSITEQNIGQGAIYRVAVEGQTPSENLSVPIETQVRSRELIFLIKNGDSPPLPISAVRVERRPVNLVFLARQPGAYHLLTGNPHCDAPRYDLASLGMDLKDVAVSPMRISPPSDNPDFRAPEVLPGLDAIGAGLDVSDWSFRKPVKNLSDGAQQIELDPDVLAHAQPGFGDLRVLNGSNQVPYIVQHTSISRALTLAVTATNDAKNLKLSRWIVKLPQSGLPVARLVCVATTPLFQREMSLYEELTDERGDKYHHDLASDLWTQTPEHQAKEFVLTLAGTPESDTLFLETENGDNPPIKLEKFTSYYPATRVLLKAKPNDELFLYYGNPRVAAPSYDLSLVAGQLLAADRKTASLGYVEVLKKSFSRDNQASGQAGALFWGILTLVVVGLLAIISRLLPKSAPPTNS